MAGRVDQRLSALRLSLPAPPAPVANYLPFSREGQLVQIAGVAPVHDGAYAVVGKLGGDVSLKDGKKAAQLCALNLMSVIKQACGGDLDRVRRFLMVRGFVNATDDFEEVPAVMNGASDLIVEAFGPDVGSHARTSIGCATLPSRVAVELDALILIDD